MPVVCTPLGEKAKEALGRAKALEKKYEWLKATELYEQTLAAVGKQNFSRKGEIQERIGHCLHRAAFQAESPEEFKQRMQRAIEAYEKSYGSYEKLVDEQKATRMFRCRAVAKYLGYWLTSDPLEKKRLLDKCLELEGKALAGFLESGDTLEYVKTFNELPFVFWFRILLEWDRQVLEGILKEGLERGEKAVAVLRDSDDPYERARAYLPLTFCFTFFRFCFLEEPEEQEENRLKTVRYLSEAVDILEKAGDAFLLGLAHFRLGANLEGQEEKRHYEKTLEYGKQARDNFLIAVSQDFLAYITYWEAVATEDPEKRRRVANEAMQLYDAAQHRYSILSFMSPRPGVIAAPAGYAEHYLELATWETDLQERQRFLERAESEAVEALELANSSKMPIIVSSVLHVVSKVLEARACMESNLSEKRDLLEKALNHREKSIKIQDELAPFFYWNAGVVRNYRAAIMAELADLEQDPGNKRRLIEEAISSEKECIELCTRAAAYYERWGQIHFFAALQKFQDSYGTLLNRLYQLTENREHLEKALEIYDKAIESASKLDLVSLRAESYWKIAKIHGILGEHLKAAKNFERASESYTKAAEKIPQLREFYQDHASYMKGWSEIEKARHHHRRQEYSIAMEHFEKAADIHKSLRQWSYLAPNYSAWARVEHAEDLSRKEQSEEALQTFEQAAQQFTETKRSVQTELNKIESLDEKQMAANILKATDLRHDYCLARIALEEAKTLDKKGDHYSSSEKFGLATKTFTKIRQALESKRDQKEFTFLISLSKAWQKMTQAEAETSPTLYIEASRHFEEAKDLSPNEKSRMLMLGHSRFCKALEAGTRFEDTRDATIYSAAKKHMETAASYYLKAGFKSASEYARGTHRLFDAYMYMHEAETETDPKKKVQYYQMAERLLQSSAGSYMKARHPEKSGEVKTLLESVKEERQLALSLTEVLHAPTITSTTASFYTPTPTHEQAVGLERFEHADIQANLILRVKEARVGEDIEFRVELVNAGKAPALLIKVDEIIPEGFEIKQAPEIYTVDDSYIDMKGKRLNPLKTEDVKMVIKPQSKGTFKMKPRILYIDETGEYKSHEPNPITITVKELGIKDWIKGER